MSTKMLYKTPEIFSRCIVSTGTKYTQQGPRKERQCNGFCRHERY